MGLGAARPFPGARDAEGTGPSPAARGRSGGWDWTKGGLLGNVVDEGGGATLSVDPADGHPHPLPYSPSAGGSAAPTSSSAQRERQHFTKNVHTTRSEDTVQIN